MIIKKDDSLILQTKEFVEKEDNGYKYKMKSTIQSFKIPSLQGAYYDEKTEQLLLLTEDKLIFKNLSSFKFLPKEK